MASTNSWHSAWDNAQPSLDSLRDSFGLLSGPSSRVIRVSQLDAESLDTDLVQLLQDPLNKALSTVNVNT